MPKGILHPDDAVRAVEHGAQAVIVSNHGGRQLDSAVATLDALPAVVEAVGGRAEVLVDGGVRRGTDILKALAWGRERCSSGVPSTGDWRSAGEAGVRHVLELLRAELALDLMLCGLATPSRGGPLPARPVRHEQPRLKPVLCTGGSGLVAIPSLVGTGFWSVCLRPLCR